MTSSKFDKNYKRLSCWIPLLLYYIVIAVIFPINQSFFETPIYTDDLGSHYTAAFFCAQNLSQCGRNWGYVPSLNCGSILSPMGPPSNDIFILTLYLFRNFNPAAIFNGTILVILLLVPWLVKTVASCISEVPRWFTECILLALVWLGLPSINLYNGMIPYFLSEFIFVALGYKLAYMLVPYRKVNLVLIIALTVLGSIVHPLGSWAIIGLILLFLFLNIDNIPRHAKWILILTACIVFIVGIYRFHSAVLFRPTFINNFIHEFHISLLDLTLVFVLMAPSVVLAFVGISYLTSTGLARLPERFLLFLSVGLLFITIISYLWPTALPFGYSRLLFLTAAFAVPMGIRGIWRWSKAHRLGRSGFMRKTLLWTILPLLVFWLAIRTYLLILTPFFPNSYPEEYEWILENLRGEAPETGRALIENPPEPGGHLFGGHIEYRTWELTGIETIATYENIPSYYHSVKLNAGLLLGRPIGSYDLEELRQVLDRYGIRWVFACSSESKEALSSFPSLWTRIQKFERLVLFEVAEPSGLIFGGSGHVTSDYKGIYVHSLRSSGSTVVLKYQYFSPLTTIPAVEIRPAPIEGNPVGFIEVLNPPEEFSLIQCAPSMNTIVPDFSWINRKVSINLDASRHSSWK